MIPEIKAIAKAQATIAKVLKPPKRTMIKIIQINRPNAIMMNDILLKFKVLIRYKNTIRTPCQICPDNSPSGTGQFGGIVTTIRANCYYPFPRRPDMDFTG